MWFRIWHPAMGPSHAAEKNSNIVAQLQSLRASRPLKKVPIIFLIQRIVIPTGYTEKYGVNDQRVVSQQ